MNVGFVEYKIDPERREAYLKTMKRLLADCGGNVTLYEGADQPNLFVETWSLTCPEDFERIKRDRLTAGSEWERMTDFIVGGKDKIHIWEFIHVLDAKC
ncbi:MULTISPECIES: MFS transporter [unclassified Paenibacillus]|uniref:MFS transporter n=1 Tax=unclassified Paenibacillus TaxID=185978 RepID=UPI001C1204F2|nr:MULTISPECIES: MFS transporter [unclassified Paenibacillus]MBU5441446.1 MFS transporter [Paenibacillus sp. MSJ-34]CAH0118315.1 hypothetical protein PAE9249_00801 [Paenibacillus sp. CECT 9249]